MGPILQRLLQMPPTEFERTVGALLQSLGFQAELTQPTADGGVDIWAVDNTPISGARIIVQCKRYGPDTTVGEPVVRELYGLVHAHGVNKGLLITTSDFTTAAVHFAAGKPLELIDGERLIAILKAAKIISELDQAIVEPAPSLEDAIRWFSDFEAVRNELDAWNREDVLPYPLKFEISSGGVWKILEGMDYPVETQPSPDVTMFLVDYFQAAHHLLQGAEYVPSYGEPTPVLEFILNRLQTITTRMGRYAGAVIPDKDAAAIRQYAALGKTRRRDGALGLCQLELGDYCNGWWISKQQKKEKKAKKRGRWGR